MGIFTEDFLNLCRSGIASAFDTGVGYLTNLFAGERSAFSEWYDEWSGFLYAFSLGTLFTLAVQRYNTFRNRSTATRPPSVEQPANVNQQLAELKSDVTELKYQQSLLISNLSSFLPSPNIQPQELVYGFYANLQAASEAARLMSNIVSGNADEVASPSDSRAPSTSYS